MQVPDWLKKYKKLPSGEMSFVKKDAALFEKKDKEEIKPSSAENVSLSDKMNKTKQLLKVMRQLSINITHSTDFPLLNHSPEVSPFLQLAFVNLWSIIKKSFKDTSFQENLLASRLINLMRLASLFTYKHSSRVSKWSSALARELGMSYKELEQLELAVFFRDIGEIGTIFSDEKFDTLEQENWGSYLASLGDIIRESAEFHDIGKLAIPSAIINKTERLTEEEFAAIKQHPVIGEEILKPLTRMQEILPAVRHHHERWDGRGYPDGLKENEIPFIAQIITVADSFDAMTEDRPYRKAMTYQQAKEELIKNSSTQFNSRLVEIFLRILESEETR